MITIITMLILVLATSLIMHYMQYKHVKFLNGMVDTWHEEAKHSQQVNSLSLDAIKGLTEEFRTKKNEKKWMEIIDPIGDKISSEMMRMLKELLT